MSEIKNTKIMASRKPAKICKEPDCHYCEALRKLPKHTKIELKRALKG